MYCKKYYWYQLENLSKNWVEHDKFNFIQSNTYELDLSNYPSSKIMLLIFKHNGTNNNNSMWFISNYFDTNNQAAYKIFEMNGAFNMVATPLKNSKIKFTIDTPRQYTGSIYLFFLN